MDLLNHIALISYPPRSGCRAKNVRLRPAYLNIIATRTSTEQEQMFFQNITWELKSSGLTNLEGGIGRDGLQSCPDHCRESTFSMSIA